MAVEEVVAVADEEVVVVEVGVEVVEEAEVEGGEEATLVLAPWMAAVWRRCLVEIQW